MKKQYIIFECMNCNQFIYAKIEQKSKKCPRCRKNHPIKQVQGHIVNGCTKAMEEVKKLQNLKITDESMNFKSTIPEVRFKTVEKNSNEDLIQDTTLFNKSIIENNNVGFKSFIQRIYEFQENELIETSIGFPPYILEILLEDIDIDNFQKKKLLNTIKSNGKLIYLSNENIYLNN